MPEDLPLVARPYENIIAALPELSTRELLELAAAERKRWRADMRSRQGVLSAVLQEHALRVEHDNAD